MMGMPGAAMGEDGTTSGSEEVPEELQQMIDDFDGAAATVRFDDGAVEVEYAMSNYQPDMTKFLDSQNGADMVAGLPDDTVAAFGMSPRGGLGRRDARLRQDAACPRTARRSTSSSRSSSPRPGSPSRRTSRRCSARASPSRSAAASTPTPSPTAARARSRSASGSTATPTRSRPCSTRSPPRPDPRLAEFMQVTEGDGYAVLALQDGYRGELEGGGSLGDSDGLLGGRRSPTTPSRCSSSTSTPTTTGWSA